MRMDVWGGGCQAFDLTFFKQIRFCFSRTHLPRLLRYPIHAIPCHPTPVYDILDACSACYSCYCTIRVIFLPGMVGSGVPCHWQKPRGARSASFFFCVLVYYHKVRIHVPSCSLPCGIMSIMTYGKSSRLPSATLAVRNGHPPRAWTHTTKTKLSPMRVESNPREGKYCKIQSIGRNSGILARVTGRWRMTLLGSACGSTRKGTPSRVV